mmetsp:Transcript_20620/g.42277  ORF Transcript_20620/g.42277 Transcript_20620/m.42277 type:complete len:203 (-) Transcript_20620:344-952(-)
MVPSWLKSMELTDVGNAGSWHSLFLFFPSHTFTRPSQPPVAKVPWPGWNAMLFTGNTVLPTRWHLNAYFLASASGSKYSIATRPSMDATANPSPSGKQRRQRVWYLSELSRSNSGPAVKLRTSKPTMCLPAVPTTSRVSVRAMVKTLSCTSRLHTGGDPKAPRGSQQFTFPSQPPVKTVLIWGAYSQQRIGFACVPRSPGGA